MKKNRFTLAMLAALALAWVLFAGSAAAETEENPPEDPKPVLLVPKTHIPPGETGVVPIVMDALGVETAFGFSVQWDPALLTYVSTSVKGTDLPPDAILLTNPSQTAEGRYGVVIGLNLKPGEGLPPATLPKGKNTIFLISFTAVGPEGTTVPVTFVNKPVYISVSDGEANPISAKTLAGTVTITTEAVEEEVPEPTEEAPPPGQ